MSVQTVKCSYCGMEYNITDDKGIFRIEFDKEKGIISPCPFCLSNNIFPNSLLPANIKKYNKKELRIFVKETKERGELLTDLITTDTEIMDVAQKLTENFSYNELVHRVFNIDAFLELEGCNLSKKEEYIDHALYLSKRDSMKKPYTSLEEDDIEIEKIRFPFFIFIPCSSMLLFFIFQNYLFLSISIGSIIISLIVNRIKRVRLLNKYNGVSVLSGVIDINDTGSEEYEFMISKLLPLEELSDLDKERIDEFIKKEVYKPKKAFWDCPYCMKRNRATNISETIGLLKEEKKLLVKCYFCGTKYKQPYNKEKMD